MKKTIAKIFRKWANRLSPEDEINPQKVLPYPYNSDLPRIIKSQYKYPKSATMMNFDLIKLDIARKMVDALLQHNAIHFSIVESKGPFNTIEGTMIVYPFENESPK